MGCAVHGTSGEELLISEKGKQTRMVKAKGIMESSQSKRGKRKWILQPRDNTLLTLLTTSSLFVGVSCNKLCSQCLCSQSFRTQVFLSQPIRVSWEPQDTPKEQWSLRVASFLRAQALPVKIKHRDISDTSGQNVPEHSSCSWPNYDWMNTVAWPIISEQNLERGFSFLMETFFPLL